MTEQKYPESEKLSHEQSEWSTLVEFMEFLASKNIRLMTYAEREWEVTCPGSLFHGCIDGFQTFSDVGGNEAPTKRKCSACEGTGVKIERFAGFEDINTSTNNLIYEHLDVDPVALEAERRAMLASLR